MHKYFSHTTRRRFKLAAGILVGYLGLAFVLSWLLPDAQTNRAEAFGVWLVWIPTTLLVMVFLELLGNWLIPLIDRFPTFIKLPLFVVLFSLAIVGVALFFRWTGLSHSA